MIRFEYFLRVERIESKLVYKGGNSGSSFTCFQSFVLSRSPPVLSFKSTKMPPPLRREATVSNWLQEYNTADSFPFLVLASQDWYCIACRFSFTPTWKSHVKKHAESSKHQENIKHLANRKAREDPNSASHVSAEDLGRKLCEAFITADIPLNKLDVPEIREFLEENIGVSMPCRTVARTRHMTGAYEEAVEKIKEELTDHPLWIGGDETTDICGRYVLHIMLGKLSMSEFHAPFLVECTFLEQANAETVAQAMNAILNKFWPGFEPSRLRLLLSDAVSYMIKCGKIMKRETYPELLHLTCLIHALHRICEKARTLFKDVNTLIKNGKKIFLKSPRRVTAWKQVSDLGLPPQVCVTRWGTWVNGAVWYSVPAHFDTFAQVVNGLDPEDAQCIEDCQEVFGSPTLREDLKFISDHLSFLPPLMRQMEETDVGLIRGLSLFEEAERKISLIPGARGDILQRKFVAVKNRNPDLQKIQSLRDEMVANRYLPDMREYKLLTYAPVHTADIERSFSHYKNIVNDKRTKLTEENVSKLVIAKCFYRRSNPEPLGIWEPMLH